MLNVDVYWFVDSSCSGRTLQLMLRTEWNERCWALLFHVRSVAIEARVVFSIVIFPRYSIFYGSKLMLCGAHYGTTSVFHILFFQAIINSFIFIIFPDSNQQNHLIALVITVSFHMHIFISFLLFSLLIIMTQSNDKCSFCFY